MTKKEYIEKHPRTILAARLQKNDWPDGTQIVIVGGLVAPNNPRSNLSYALRGSKLGKWLVGGRRQHATEGYWIAVA